MTPALCKTGLAYILAEKTRHVYTTVAIIGVPGVIAWSLSATTGRNDGLDIMTLSFNLANYVATGGTECFD